MKATIHDSDFLKALRPLDVAGYLALNQAYAGPLFLTGA